VAQHDKWGKGYGWIEWERPSPSSSFPLSFVLSSMYLGLNLPENTLGASGFIDEQSQNGMIKTSQEIIPNCRKAKISPMDDIF
jgi:hypothetical protein